MVTTTRTGELREALAEFERRITVLRDIIETRERRHRQWSALNWAACLAAIVISMMAVGITAYHVATAPGEPATAARPLGAARLFALFPDGSVEVSDPWGGRRIFRWDGEQWRALEPPPGPGGSQIRRVSEDRPRH